MDIVNIIGAFILALGLLLLGILGFCFYLFLVIESVKEKLWVPLILLIGGTLTFLGIVLFLV